MLSCITIVKIVNKIRSEVDPEAEIINGSIIDPALDGKIRVSIVATALDGQQSDSKSVINMVHRIQNRNPGYSDFTTSNGVTSFNFSNASSNPVSDGANALKLENEVVSENIKKFGVPVVVAINDFITDTEKEHLAIINYCGKIGVECKISSHWEKGGKGAADLAEEVAKIADSNLSDFKTLYDSKMPLWDKTKHIAQKIYGASEIIADKKVRNQFQKFEDDGFGEYPICMAKTQYSFSTDPLLMGAPSGHDVPIKEVRLSAGAEFIVVVCGDIMTMPGLPRIPAAENIDVDDEGLIQGLF